MAQGFTAAGTKDLGKAGATVDQTVQPLPLSSEEDGKQRIPEHIMENHQVIIFPGSTRTVFMRKNLLILY